MSETLEYLKEMPVLFINVDGHTEREQQFRENTAPLFGEVVRIPAVPVVDEVAEGNDFINRVNWTREHADPEGYYAKMKIYMVKQFHRPSARAREYACTRSLVLSVLKAIDAARMLGYDEFMLMEDDAFPRMDELADMPLPPLDAEMAVWGGAYTGGIKKDNELYLAGKKPTWTHITGRHRRYFTQAYSMTQSAADAMEKAINEHFFAVDMAWWYAHDMVKTYQLSPSAFVQKGGSVRAMRHNFDTREGVASRSEMEKAV